MDTHNKNRNARTNRLYHINQHLYPSIHRHLIRRRAALWSQSHISKITPTFPWTTHYPLLFPELHTTSTKKFLLDWKTFDNWAYKFITEAELDTLVSNGTWHEQSLEEKIDTFTNIQKCSLQNTIQLKEASKRGNTKPRWLVSLIKKTKEESKMDSEYLHLTPESKQKMQPKQTSQSYKITNQPNYQNTSFNIGPTTTKDSKKKYII